MLLLLAATKSSNIAFGSAPSIIAAVLIIAGAAGMIFAYTRTNLARSTIELQAQQIEAQSQRIETLEKTIVDQKRGFDEQLHSSQNIIEQLNKRTETLENSMRVLENLKTGSEAVNKLAEQMDQRHLELAASLGELKQLMTDAR